MSRITAKAYAKLNLYLDITGMRSDGYHELESVMQLISLHDIVDIEINEGSGITISCDRPEIPSDERNIAYKAAQRYLEAAGLSRRVDICIKKNIPSGAGMGGGSADAAAVLRSLHEELGAPVSRERLFDIAAALGADVPFCLAGGTKICRGIGEIMEDMEPFYGCYLVIMPDFTCPTGAAYKKYDSSPVPVKGRLDSFIGAAARGSFHTELYNVFEVLYNDERIVSVKEMLMEAGAMAAMMTGSGAAVFGVFESPQAAQKAAERCSGVVGIYHSEVVI